MRRVPFTARVLFARAFVAVLACAARAEAQIIAHEATLLPQTPSAFDHAGSAVAFSGNFAFFGVPDADLAGADSGAVEMWRLEHQNGWIFLCRFCPADAVAGDRFGAALSCTGTALVVGAPGADVNGVDSGAVYSYSLFGGPVPPTLIEKLAPSDGQAGDAYGSVIALEPSFADSHRLVVGVPEADPNGTSSGAAYAYQRAGVAAWTFTKKHVGPPNSPGARFGAAVAINVLTYNRILVGAPGHDDVGVDSGSAWQGVPNAASLTKLVIPGLAAGDQAGTSVALVAGRVCIGMPGCDLPAPDAGRVASFDSLGVLLNSFQPAAVSAGDAFGTRLGGDWTSKIVVGAPGDDGAGPDAGAFYRFDTSFAGTEIDRNVSPTPYAGQHFGQVLWYSPFYGPRLVFAGDPTSSLAANEAGVVEAYVTPDAGGPLATYCVYNGPGTQPLCPCGPVPTDRGCPNSAGGGAMLQGSGYCSFTIDTLHLVANDLPTSSVGILVRSTISGNPGMNGDGRSCFGGSVLRLLVSATTNATLEYGYGTGGTPLSTASQAPPGGGTNFYYQVYYRDSASFCTSATFNFTNGVQVFWGP